MSNVKRGRPFQAPPPFAMPVDLLGYNIVRLAHLKKMRDEARFKSKLGISLSQFGALMMLYETPGLSAGQLARWLLLTPQSTAVLLADLETRRFIERERGAKLRGKRIGLHITKKGGNLIQRGSALVAETEAEVRLGLTESEADTLNRLLIQLAEAYMGHHRALQRAEYRSAPRSLPVLLQLAKKNSATKSKND